MSISIEVSPVVYGFDIETNQYFDYSNLYKCKTMFHGYFDWKYIKDKRYICSIKQAHDAYNRMIADVEERCVSNGLDAFMTNAILTEHKMQFDELVFHGDWTDTGKRNKHKFTFSGLIPLSSEIYLGCFIKHEFDYDVVSRTLKDIKNSVCSVKADYVYSVSDVDMYLKNIENDALTTYQFPMCAVVCIHNLSYEMQLISQTSWFKEKVSMGLVDALGNGAKDTYKTVTVKTLLSDGDVVPIVKFIDTWKLTNSSIESLGNAYGLPKLDYDYEEIRYKSDLTAIDYEYNRRDVEISLIAFLTTMGTYKRCMFKKSAKNPSGFRIDSANIPISANHAVNIFSAYKFHDDMKFRNEDVKRIMKNITENMYIKFRAVCGGGLVAINPLLAYNEIGIGTIIDGFPIKGISHIDLNSAHPSQVYKRLFPISAPVAIDDREYIDVIKEELEVCITRMRNIQINDAFAHIGYNVGKRTYSGFGVFRLKDMKIKRWYNSVEIPVAWYSRIYNRKSGRLECDLTDTEIVVSSGENVITNRGKIISADVVEMNVTIEDLLIISLFYDFKLDDIVEYAEYEMGYANKFLIDQIDYFASEKTTYKEFTKLVNKYGMDALSNNIISSSFILDTDRQELLSVHDKKELEKVAFECLKRAKARFNGIYGTTYQSIIREKLKLLVDDDCVQYITSDDFQKRNEKVHFLQGAYIAQWSRVDIALWAYESVRRGYIPFYIATDSIYMGIVDRTQCYSDAELCNGFNTPVNAMAKRFTNKTRLGGMSLENPIVKLEYIDCLKIIYDEVMPDGEVVTRKTISGTNADVLFDGVNPYEKLRQENIYVSAFENGKLIKKGGTEENPFRVFIPSAVILNDTNTTRYQENKKYSIKLQ